MARKIEKKVISDDLLFGDDFDESKLAKIEANLVRSPTTPGGSEEEQARATEAGEATEPKAPGGEPAGSPSEAALDQETRTGESAADQVKSVSEKQKAAVARVVRSKLILLAAAGSLLLLIATGLLSLYWFNWRQEAHPPSQFVRHSIVVPSHRHLTSFLLFVGPTGKKKDLVKVDAELEFWSTQAYEMFKSKQVLFCDVIYKFLSKQGPPENSFQHWEKILEMDLLESLQSNYPETRLNAVRMQGFQRL